MAAGSRIVGRPLFIPRSLWRRGGSWLAGVVAVSLARQLDSSPSWPVPVWPAANVWDVDSLHAWVLHGGAVEGARSSNGERTHIQGAMGCNKYMRHGQIANLTLCQRQHILVLTELFHLMSGTQPMSARRSLQQSDLFLRRRELQSTSEFGNDSRVIETGRACRFLM